VLTLFTAGVLSLLDEPEPQLKVNTFEQSYKNLKLKQL